MAFVSLLRVGATTWLKHIFQIHNCTCIATDYQMSPINNSTTICTSFTCFMRRAGVFTVAANPTILGPRMSPVEIAFWCLGSNLHNCCTISTSTYSNTTSFKLETNHPPSQRTLFNLAQTPGNLATVWGGPYVNVFAVHNQHLESSILLLYSRVAWARTSIHVQEYGTRHQHDFHLTPDFLESMLQLSLQPPCFSNSAIARRVR